MSLLQPETPAEHNPQAVNPALSDGLPAFLTANGGLNSVFMIPQYVAAALVSESKALCHPASVDSIPTSANQEDHVSMGNAAGLKAWQVLANAERVVAIELLAGAQAVEFHAPLEPGVGPRAVRELVRSLSPRLGDDRSLSDDIEAICCIIRVLRSSSSIRISAARAASIAGAAMIASTFEDNSSLSSVGVSSAQAGSATSRSREAQSPP